MVIGRAGDAPARRKLEWVLEMTIRTTALAAAAVLGLTAMALSGCETATPYQPLAKGEQTYGGYRDERLDADHFRVSFRGNTLTSRATVENYLLYRAAELAVANGFDWFETVDQHTDKQQHTYVDGFGYGYGFSPYWRFYGRRYGWRGFYGGPLWDDGFDVQTVQRFEATADVVMGHGPKPAGDKRAFDAREVMANLGPHIKRPGQK